MAKTTATNKNRITPESRVIEKPVIKTEPKIKKIKMNATYISADYCLMVGKEYEIDSSLAKLLIKNREASEC